jgi:hypothetical protein
VLALWLSSVGGWAVMNGGFWEDMTFVFSGYWMGTAVLGGSVLEWLRRRSQKAGKSYKALTSA